MGKFVTGNGQYVVYADNQDSARQVLMQELGRIDDIKEKMANLLSQDGKAIQNFLENTAEENLNIHFNDETSLIYDNPDNATTKGEVRQRNFENGKFTYDLAYRYPDIQGHNADFRLAHEMGHLMLNPSNSNRQVYDSQTDSRQVSGLIRRTENGQFYGTQIQENAINLIAQLAVRGEHTADDIITGKADVSEFNSYKKADDLVKLLAVSMRNDYDKEMSFEQLTEQKIDSFIEHSDGTKEPANTFFYGILNDSSMIENEFNKYMGKGAWRDLDSAFQQLHQPNISQEKFDNVFQTAQALVTEFANVRMKEKQKEAFARNGQDVPSLDNKINMIREMTGNEQQLENHSSNEFQFPEGYKINEFGEIIRPTIDKEQLQQSTESKFTFKQKIAQFFQKSNLFMNLPFVEKFVNQQLNVLPSPEQETITPHNSRENFINQLTNFGEYRNLPPPRRMSDPEKLSQMQRKMEQNQHSADDNERY